MRYLLFVAGVRDTSRSIVSGMGQGLVWQEQEGVVKHPVDVHVGKRVRHRRWMVGMTQQQLAEKVGIKFQQIQKYETGMNRVSASRLWDISEALSVPVAYFFEGMDGAEAAQTADAGQSSLPGDILADKEALELVRSYYAIPENQRRRLFELARVLSDAAA
jgi:transcriptional regulator with XRE-family HTH domain